MIVVMQVAQDLNHGRCFYDLGNEVVIWTVMQQPLKIREEDVQLFRDLRISKTDPNIHLVDNYRPLQSLNGRVVRYYPGQQQASFS